MHSQDRDRLIDRMVEGAAQRMAHDIDQELMDDMRIAVLVNEGWTETNINPGFSEYSLVFRPVELKDWYSETAEWVHKNAQGDYRLVKGQWLFQDPRDATLFILRWSA